MDAELGWQIPLCIWLKYWSTAPVVTAALNVLYIDLFRIPSVRDKRWHCANKHWNMQIIFQQVIYIRTKCNRNVFKISLANTVSGSFCCASEEQGSGGHGVTKVTDAGWEAAGFFFTLFVMFLLLWKGIIELFEKVLFGFHIRKTSHCFTPWLKIRTDRNTMYY